LHLNQQAFIWFGCLIAAVIPHEISHGVVALWFGDDTAKRAGRLTLNPIPHIDPFGSIVMPLLGAITGLPFIAWAKPVPINPQRLRNPRRDMLFVGLAGPTTNFLLMLASALIARSLLAREHLQGVVTLDSLSLGFQIALSFALVNLFLGVFNLLPIPPLDGSSLIERVLPPQWLPGWYKFRPYGFLVLFILVFSTGFLTRIITPFENALIRFIAR
jgi:Zn-dependent protease